MTFPDSFDRQTGGVRTSRGDHGLYLHGPHLKAFVHTAALLMVTRMGPALKQARAAHANDVAEALADALQFRALRFSWRPERPQPNASLRFSAPTFRSACISC